MEIVPKTKKEHEYQIIHIAAWSIYVVSNVSQELRLVYIHAIALYSDIAACFSIQPSPVNKTACI